MIASVKLKNKGKNLRPRPGLCAAMFTYFLILLQPRFNDAVCPSGFSTKTGTTSPVLCGNMFKIDSANPSIDSVVKGLLLNRTFTETKARLGALNKGLAFSAADYAGPAAR